MAILTELTQLSKTTNAKVALRARQVTHTRPRDIFSPKICPIKLLRNSRV